VATLVNLANGDARFALNTLEMASVAADADSDHTISAEMISEVAQRRAAVYDKSGEAHFDTISALHKSIRDSDADATLYWLCRMLEGGDDPLYIVRRLVRAASEDVGLADPRALQITMAAQQAVHFLGVPEGNLALAEAAVFLALAPKSNALYQGYAMAREDVESTRNDPVPMHLRNAVTGLMRGLGYGKDYQYAHDDSDAVVDQSDLPENLAGRRYYQPTERGFEAQLTERVARRRELIARKRAE
jgi:putative ATPase